MVIPGKSGRSWSRTSPMFIRARPAAAAPETTLIEDRSSTRVPREEHQAVLADLHLVAVGELHPVDPVAVHVGAVQAADVADGERLAGPVELRVPARDRHVV